jgi:hypothetical protein
LASKESDTKIKYDEGLVQGLFLHALETGLADETIRAKMRPLLKNESVADEELIEVMSSAMAAESERATKFNQVGRVKSSPKVSKIETGAPPRPAESPNAHDSDILATLKAIQAELNTVQSEVASLQTQVDQKDSPQGHSPSSTFMTGRVGQNRRNDGRQGDYPSLCKKCHEENQVNCPHCFKCGGKKSHCPILQVGKREEATPEGLGVAASKQNKSHRCNGCNQEEVHANFKRCSTCKLVYYCSKSCQKRHWSEHQIHCNAITEQLNQNNETLRGLGDSSDTEMFASHFSPKKHAAIDHLRNRLNFDLNKNFITA